jgi:4-amino-4-deoxy-L-arabinose transferase-like glycosyltransferase
VVGHNEQAVEPEPPATPPRSSLPPSAPGKLRFELAVVTVLALALLLPGVWSYSLIDPWETHYGEVARRMLQDRDWVHTQWQDEGFRSKPVLTFWLMAASMKALGVAGDGGYSGELAQSPVTMLAIRLPFVLFGVLGLVLTWWVLTRLVSRRVAYLGLLVIGTCPFYALVARQGITDMTLVACMMGAVAMWLMALELGDVAVAPRPWRLPGWRRQLRWSAWWPLALWVGGFALAQAVYYAVYFTASPELAPGVRFPVPQVVLPAAMALGVGALLSPRLTLRLPALLIGVLIAAARGAIPREAHGTLTQDVIEPADRFAVDRLLLRALAWPLSWTLGGSARLAWLRTAAPVERLLTLRPLTSMRQVYLGWFYALLALSVLGKGLPALGIIGVVGLCHLALTNGWRALLRGDYELRRGVILMAVLCVPWHQAMYLKEGGAFVREYFITHLLNRAAVGVFGERGTFEFYLSQLGYGMWIWVALLPPALAWVALTVRPTTREGRVRLVVAIWAITSVAFFSLVQTKFHHYILPAVPALGLLVAFFLDDVLAGRARVSALWAALAAAVVLLLTRDMMGEEKQWVEMFIFRYDRPWPSAAPWSVDTSDGFLGLGLASAAAVLTLATRWRRFAVALVGAAALATALWSMHVYMPIAGTHWGMRDAIRAYYRERQIDGPRVLYFTPAQLLADWGARPRSYSFDVFVPDQLVEGQPMTVRLTVNRASAPRVTESDTLLRGTVERIVEHRVTVALPEAELRKLDPVLAAARRAPAQRAPRPPVRVMEGDRLIAWQLYWRGENFWTGDEIFGWLPEHKAAFIKTDNVAFTKYINDRALCPLGKRYFVITESGRALGLRSALPTQRAKDSFEVVDTTSNKFTLVAFYL